jgi:hypothetical protein
MFEEHCMFVFSIQVASCISVIPNLGYAYSQGYESGHLGVHEKKLNNDGKGTYINT